jgi:peptidoglycan/LPS O-acetylase OafA/YrhL
MSKSGSAHNIPVLDGLRAISILLVMAAHLLPLGPKPLLLNATAANMGMSLFFGLSGFLITSGLIRNPSVHEFLARRLARILPLAYLYTAIVFLGLTFDPKALLWTDLFLTNYLQEFSTVGLNGHLWSLCVEIHFYLAIALAVFIIGPRAVWLVWPACLAVTLMRIKVGAPYHPYTHLRVDDILSGACVATLVHYNTKLKAIRVPPAAMVAALLVLAISSSPFSSWLQYDRPYATAFLLLASLNYGMTHPETVLGSRPARYIATISYALYVVHCVTAYGWMNEGGTVVKYLLKRPISFALTFAIAHFSTVYWERPWQIAVKKQIEKRRREYNSRAIPVSVEQDPGANQRVTKLGRESHETFENFTLRQRGLLLPLSYKKPDC